MNCKLETCGREIRPSVYLRWYRNISILWSTEGIQKCQAAELAICLFKVIWQYIDILTYWGNTEISGGRAGHLSVQGDITIYRYCEVQRPYRKVRRQNWLSVCSRWYHNISILWSTEAIQKSQAAELAICLFKVISQYIDIVKYRGHREKSGGRTGHLSVQGDIAIYRYCHVQRAYKNVRRQSRPPVGRTTTSS